MNEPDTDIGPRVLTMQIIASALIAGVLFFVWITLFLGAWNEPEEEGVMKYVGIGMIIVEVIPLVIVPALITANSIRKTMEAVGQSPGDTSVLLGVYQTRMVLRYALIEGAAFFNAIAFMLEHARWSLGLVAALVLVMLVMFPTRTKVAHWLEAEQMRGDVVQDPETD